MIVKEILLEVEKFGLVGEQHFYIQFDLSCMGVSVPERVREKHQQGSILVSIKRDEYQNLLVNDMGLQVDLGFDGFAETIFVPFTSIMSFTDPSENLLLEFQVQYQMEPIVARDQEARRKRTDENNIIIFPKPQ
jgi:hypothetical protein